MVLNFKKLGVIILILILLGSTIAFAMADDQQGYFSCGGDAEATFMCPISDVDTSMNPQIRGQPPDPTGYQINIPEKIQKLGVSPGLLYPSFFILFSLLITFLVIFFKRRKKRKENLL
jgi:hypothetical protein